MKSLNLVQGSPEWEAARRRYFTASEASIMMACSPNVKRNELLHMKATGTDREFSDWFQRNILDKGHEIEAKARPIAEQIVGEELYPVTATDDEGYLLASFDGITMLENIVWECKQWNEEKARTVMSGSVPECDYWQVVQQLVVSGAEKALYMVTDGTSAGTVHMWVELNSDDAERLLLGWQQFASDLSTYVPTESKPEPVGKAIEDLPALRVELSGEVRATNLPEFKQRALAMIEAINTDLQTDQDFADAEKAIKALDKGEKQLEAAKKAALEQTASIDELFRTVDHLKAEMRDKRLALNKLVKAEKENRRAQIINAAREAFQQWLEQQQSPIRLGINFTPAEAMKGKKTISSLQSAADDALAAAKIDAKQTIDRLKANHDLLKQQSEGFEFLFSDWAMLIEKAADDLQATIDARIAKHKADEQARLEREREQIRQEEARKAQAAAERERREREAAERMQQAQAERAALQAQKAAPVAPIQRHERVDVAAEDTVTISRVEYEQLLADQRKLRALEQAGVAHWSGYAEAVEAAT
jgi:predicted phage-related endonuclease